jgi:hypothetical protein
MRPAASALLVAAALVAGCAREDRSLSEGERRACETFAAHADSPGSDGYKSAFARCAHDALHPERGGG